MLFKDSMIKPILDGVKTETRRVWSRCMVREDKIYKARTNYSKNSIFALIKITYVRKEKLGDVDQASAIREGYNSLNEFIKEWSKIYGSWDPDLPVYVIGFKVVRAL